MSEVVAAIPPEAYLEIEADQERADVSRSNCTAAYVLVNQATEIVSHCRPEDLTEDQIETVLLASWALRRKLSARFGSRLTPRQYREYL